MLLSRILSANAGLKLDSGILEEWSNLLKLMPKTLPGMPL